MFLHANLFVVHSENEDETCLQVKSKKSQDEANQFARLSKTPQKVLTYFINSLRILIFFL
jgi:hypothetical protein